MQNIKRNRLRLVRKFIRFYLQKTKGGPVQKISIPKDREGKQRTYGFITYKHVHSVEYALRLFDGTMLYNRILNMKLRNNTELQQMEQSLNPVRNVNYMLELGQQMILGNYSSQINDITFDINISQDAPIYPRQLNASSDNEDRIRRNHTYQRNRDRKQERDRNRNRERNRNKEKGEDRGRSKERNQTDYYRDERLYHNRDNSCHPNGYPRYCNNRKKWNH